MIRRLVSLAAASVLIVSVTVAPVAAASPASIVAGPPRGLVLPRGTAGLLGRGKPTVNMTYHNGAIMPTANTSAIFWGTSWGTYSDETTGTDLFYTGFSNSNYAKTSD